MANCTIIDLKPQDLAVVRARVAMSEIASVYERAYRAVIAAVGQQGLTCTGPAIGYYPAGIGEVMDVEAGFPTDRPIAPTAEVVPSRLPSGRAACTLHVGSYDTLAQTWGELFAWIQEQGLTPGQGLWECYITDPSQEPDSSRWQTQLFAALAH